MADLGERTAAAAVAGFVPQVCFAMFMPNLLRNFLYARHNSGCWPLDFIMRLVASELHCCANFSRKFFWSSKCTPGWVPGFSVVAWVLVVVELCDVR